MRGEEKKEESREKFKMKKGEDSGRVIWNEEKRRKRGSYI